MGTKTCRYCKHATIHEFDKEFKVISWYCTKNKEVVPAYITYTYCKEFEHYESNLHDHDAARPNPQTRDNGIHHEE